MPELTQKQRAALDALLTSGTLTEAAGKAGISRRTLTRYIDNPAFKAAMRAEQGRALGGANTMLAIASRESVGLLREVVTDAEEQASVRVNAARIILDRALAYNEAVDILARLEALEGNREQ